MSRWQRLCNALAFWANHYSAEVEDRIRALRVRDR